MENINLIRKIAWAFHDSTGEEWDDLFQEAALAYLQSMDTYNTDRGALTTHMWHCMANHLKNYLKVQQKQKGHFEYLEEVEKSEVYIATNSTFLDDFSQEAYEITKVIFKTPQKFVVLTLEQAEERLYHILTRKGWSREKIQRGLGDLKLVCQANN